MQLADMQAKVGEVIGTSRWFEMSQDRIDAFAETTEDRQFIHIDPEAAKATPFGGTIAHGFLSLSLITYLTSETMPVPEGTVMTINYGSDKVRYITPVRVGRRIRATQKVLDVAEKAAGRWLVKTAVVIEIDGEEAPAAVAEILFMHITG